MEATLAVARPLHQPQETDDRRARWRKQRHRPGYARGRGGAAANPPLFAEQKGDAEHSDAGGSYGPNIAEPPRNHLPPFRFSEGDAGAKRQQGMPYYPNLPKTETHSGFPVDCGNVRRTN